MDELKKKRLERIFSRQFPELSREKVKEAAALAEGEQPLFSLDEDDGEDY